MPNETLLTMIKPMFSMVGIPEYIWMPIVANESSWNPATVYVTDREVSKGLFQINVKAHPEYADADLYDPVVNTRIAIDDFLLPAYQQASKITSDPKRQALIVYSGLVDPDDPSKGYLDDGAGIRPKWTTDTRKRFEGYYDQYLSTSGIPIPITNEPYTIFGNDVGTTSTDQGGIAWGGDVPEITTMSEQVAKWVIVGVVVLIVGVAVFSLLKGNQTLKIEGGSIK